MSRLQWNYAQTPLFPPVSSERASGQLSSAMATVSSADDWAGFQEAKLHNLSGLAGDSVGTYGGTDCYFPGGARSDVTTSGCNKPCTVAHEAVHLEDIKDCCRAANLDFLLAGTDQAKQEVRTRWTNWKNLVRPITECRAYDVSVPCADRLLKDKKCDRQQMTPDEKECCGEIQLARDDDRAGQDKYKCESTPRQIPKCPFTDATPGPRLSDTEMPAPDDTMATQQPDEAMAQTRMRRT
jgi:hypothetical protein